MSIPANPTKDETKHDDVVAVAITAEKAVSRELNVKEDALVYQLKSEHDSQTIKQALWIARPLVLGCLCAGFCAALDGAFHILYLT